MKPTIAVLYFPGNNCETETLEAVRAAGMGGRIVRWNTDQHLGDFDGYIIPGGWSYEDRIRAGVIAAKDPVLDVLREQADRGKPILGICNGAQVLIESGIVPGIKEGVEFALAPNINPAISGYYNTWINLAVTSTKRNAFTNQLAKNETLSMPIAHGEGRFVTKNRGLVKALERSGQVVFKYCNAEGKISTNFPTNPNGSILGIAALMNKKGNVMAMMPHPERAIREYQYQDRIPSTKTTNNLAIFHSIKKYLL